MLSDDYSPYCGLTYDRHNRVQRAATQPHIMVSAPTRTGKTRRILAPGPSCTRAPSWASPPNRTWPNW